MKTQPRVPKGPYQPYHPFGLKPHVITTHERHFNCLKIMEWAKEASELIPTQS